MSDKSEQQILPAPGPKGAIHQVAAAEIDQQVATARRFPRDAIAAKANSMAIATRNQETATACFYLLKRGKKRIIGPSIRLAEILCQNWGNLRCDTRIEEIGRTRLTAASAVWDLERNVLVIMRSQRGITYSHGGRYNEDMITTTANAAASIAFRNAVFKLIPPDITEAIFQKCQAVAAGDAKSLADNRVKMVEEFEKIDVPLDVILNEFGAQHLDDLGLQQMLFLRAAYTSITKEGIDATSVFQGRKKEEGAQASQAGGPAPSPAAQSSDGDGPPETPPEGQKAAHRSEGDAPNAADIIANAQADPSKADTPRVYDSTRQYAWVGVTKDGEEVSGMMEAPDAGVVEDVLVEERGIKPTTVTEVPDTEEPDPARDAPPDPDGDQDAEPDAPYDWKSSIVPAGARHDERVVVWEVLWAKSIADAVRGIPAPRRKLEDALEDLAMQVARLKLSKKRLQLTFSSAPGSYYECPDWEAAEKIPAVVRWVVERLEKKPTPGATRSG